ncbi:MAG: tetratricopeptide repeat protein [Thermodesulfobacteriota bacterium]
MKRMGLVFLALLLAVTFVSTGCLKAPEPEPTPTPAAPAPEPVKVISDNPAGDLKKAGVAIECGHYDIALNLLEGVLNADITDRMRAVAWNYVGLAKFWTQDYAGAIDAFSKAIELAPGYDAAYYNRGFAYLKSGDKAAAAADIAKAQSMGYYPQSKVRRWCPSF